MKRSGLILSGIMVLTFALLSAPPLFAGEEHPQGQMGHGMEKKSPEAEQVVIDPVCGMNIKPEEAAGHAKYKGKTYYFCMASEVETFKKDPEKYLAQIEGLKPSGHDHGEADHPHKADDGEKGHHAMEGHEDHGMHAGHWMAPAAEAKKKNPVTATPESAAKGQKTYTTYCAVCHGSGGKADGFLAATLDPKPADLTGKKSRMHPDGDLFWKISQGKGTMPGWAEALSEEDRWHLVNYIRSLQK